LLSWGQVLEWRAAVSPGAVALTDQQGAELTYGGLAVAVERSAASYAAAGVQPGDVVPIIARNRAEWAVAMFGLARAGALPAAVNWRLAAPEVAALLELMRPAALVTDADCAPLAKEALAGSGGPAVLLPLGAEPSTDPEPGRRVPDRTMSDRTMSDRTVPDRTVPDQPMSDRAASERTAPPARGREPLILLHTSGTTGRPKLAPLTHEMLVAAVVFMKLEVPEALVGARHLSALPLFHVAGLANLGYALFTGGHLHLLDGFDPAGFVDELVARRIQLTQLVPTLIRAVTEEVAGRSEPPDLSHLTEIVYGASPIQPDLLARAVRTLGCRFRQNYASTETGPLPISSLAPADHDPARGRLATAGRPSLGWEVRIGDLGEVQVRGSVPLPGYWHNPEATGQVTTPDGFHRTGDVGVLDDGYLTIIDRLTDMIISGGENVYPSEVEAVLAGHPGVADVAVIGIPDPRWGETVHAVVVGRPGLDTGELLGWARGRLAGFKCPTSVTIAGELPRNATGKVLRSVLREPHWAGHDRRVS
jgi:acyl-CoA synthetase (AMP-forming)/AMP-acid ligase II